MSLENLFYLITIIIMYIVVFYAIPSYVLYPVVKDKPFGYRIFVYLIASHFYVLNVVYLLGYSHLFHWSTLLLFLVIVPIVYRTYRYRTGVKFYYHKLSELNRGNSSLRLLIKQGYLNLKSYLRKRYGDFFRNNILEIVAFIVLLIIIMAFYGYYKFNYSSYGVSDEEVHLYWIQSLQGGTFFVSGMYPFSMHSVCSVLVELTGINSTIVLHYISVIMLAQIVICFYFLMRKFFKFRIGIIFAIFMWLLSGYGGMNTYFRYQFSLPMEYGLIAVFAAIVFMISYIEDKDKISLWFFGFSVSLTFSTHFYLTGLVALICICMGIVYIWPLLRKKIIHLLIGMAVLGLVMAAVPFGVGFMLGYPFEQSIGWALSVMDVTDEYLDDAYSYRDGTSDGQSERDTSDTTNSETEMSEEESKKVYSLKNPQDIYDGIYEGIWLYGGVTQREIYAILIMEVALFIFGSIGLVFAKEKKNYSFYIGIAISWLLLGILAVAEKFGINQFVEEKRVIEWLFMINTLLFAGVAELIFRVLSLIFRREDFSRLVLVYATGMLMYFDVTNGYYRTERTCAMIQTEAVANLCNELSNDYETNSWTLVSPVNEISMILNSGYHYELVDFIDELNTWDEEQKIYIPTEYIFFTIEKYQVTYTGVDVLAKKDIEGRDKISEEYALKEINFDIADNLRSELYQEQRREIMSRTYYWALEYSKLFPQEMIVFYEDEEVIIFRLKQDIYALNNLSINYKYN